MLNAIISAQRHLKTYVVTSTVRIISYKSMEADVSSIIKLEENPHSDVFKEGKAEILKSPEGKVFYNPVQEFNRDLSVLALQIFSKNFHKKNNEGSDPESKKSFRILEALSASGLRSIRYAKEIPNVSQVIANDSSVIACENILQNIKHNKVEHIVQMSCSDAKAVMYNNLQPSQQFQAVDLDPYGSPVQFLDSAVQCVANGGMLLVTCTDTSILCGNFPETCYVKYGALSLRVPSCHEMAIRIVLQNIQSHASRYKKYIVPLLSVSADFYIRVFVKVFTSAAACKQVTSKLSMVYHCVGCDALTLQPLSVLKKAKDDKNFKHAFPQVPMVSTNCVHCGGKHHMGGPIWNGPLHDQIFVSEMLKSKELNELSTSKRLSGMLSVILEELHDVPLFYSTAKICAVVKCTPIPMLTIRSAILNAGYRVSYSHACKVSVKTDAPMSFIWDIVRAWVKENPVNPKHLVSGSPAETILKGPIEKTVDFSLRPDANPLSREKKLTRYQENPLPFWGPGCRSTSMNLSENPKKVKNQNKKRGKRNNDDFSDSVQKQPRTVDS